MAEQIAKASAAALLVAFASFESRVSGQTADIALTTWRTVERFSAPEAFQAAAADRDFFYAISSTDVARYDRETKQAVANSLGAAKHLNSGYIWEGRLLCAHSNYPILPERSEVKVLDLKTMQLATFHDFGSYGGSLTWIVRHNRRWWCNFAKYGKENSATFLAEMDDQWNEIRRWSYPAHVIKQLGRYSLSGGIWIEDHLFVTGHDDQFVYQLRLPARGTVLKYVGKHSVPFQGQGIALDPLTNGIVGIDRSRREVIVFAPRDEPTAPAP